jgi:hypothetical protein
MSSRSRAGDNLFPRIRAFFFSLNLIRAGQQRIGYAVDQMSVSSTASSSSPESLSLALLSTVSLH